MDFGLVATILIDGLISAGWLFIVSVGLTLVFGVLNILNIAHGSLYAIGAYAGASMAGAWLGGAGEAVPWTSYLVLIVALPRRPHRRQPVLRPGRHDHRPRERPGPPARRGRNAGRGAAGDHL